MTIVTEAVSCPMCQGTGRDLDIKSGRMAKCELCQGKGWVPTEACKGCGKPAYKFWPPRQMPIIRYCGLEECLKHLVNIHLPAKAAIVAAVEALKAHENDKFIGPART